MRIATQKGKEGWFHFICIISSSKPALINARKNPSYWKRKMRVSNKPPSLFGELQGGPASVSPYPGTGKAEIYRYAWERKKNREYTSIGHTAGVTAVVVTYENDLRSFCHWKKQWSTQLPQTPCILQWVSCHRHSCSWCQPVESFPASSCHTVHEHRACTVSQIDICSCTIERAQNQTLQLISTIIHVLKTSPSSYILACHCLRPIISLHCNECTCGKNLQTWKHTLKVKAPQLLVAPHAALFPVIGLHHWAHNYVHQLVPACPQSNPCWWPTLLCVSDEKFQPQNTHISRAPAIAWISSCLLSLTCTTALNYS